MKVHKFRATTEADAFRQVRSELGVDAIVLSVQPVRPGGLGSLFGKAQGVEVTAVADLLSGGGRTEAALPPPSRPSAAPSRWRQENADIRATLQELTVALGRMNQSEATVATAGALHDNLRAVYGRLMEQEVAPRLADRLLAAVREELSPRALDDRRTIIDCLRRHITQLVPPPEPVAIPKGLPISLFLIGPTGVGKTTTLAKMAARFALLEGQRVALVTTDTFRVGAAEQLRVYADIIGVPLEIAYTTADLAAAVHAHRSADIILIDTPGRSQHNAAHLNELNTFIQAVPARLVYLTVDANTRYSDMLSIAERFSLSQIDGVVITKIDETTQYGSVLSLIDHIRRPLAYMTTGQEVPDDIEEGTAQRLTELVLGGAA